MSRRRVTWAVVGGRIDEFCHCLRCGEGLTLPMPIRVEIAIGAAKGFEEAHRHCKESGWKEPEPSTPEEWIKSRDVGVSSVTIWSVMTGIPSPYHRYDTPKDGADYGRCRRLLERFPAWWPRLGEVVERFPEWRPVVERLGQESQRQHVPAIAALCLLVGLLVGSSSASPAEAGDPWVGYLEWRGEVVILKSCCGPIRAPVAVRALDVAWNRVRADLDAAGYKHVPIPKLGTPAEPYTIVVEPPPGSCPVQPDGKPARGCSRTRPGGRNTWSQSINVDRVKDRLAPTRHEPEHSLCVKLRALLRSMSIEDLYANRTICAQAGHPGPGGVRLNVLGEAPR